MSIREVIIRKQENEYREYIMNHKLNVEKAWERMKNNQEVIAFFSECKKFNNLDMTIDIIDDMIRFHDSSKFEKDEFDAYRKQFYPITPEEKEENKAAFDKAWKHHYFNNMHHWNWWYESGNKDNMPFLSVVEMICDWEAMGYHFGNTSKEFYEKNKNNIHLGDEQRKFAEQLMDIICK